ncbi:transmembrane protein 174 [Anoplopoma fimbria]|uniref:transmembrane protein 174 n=1 Tax=Anoplopoma fimbria TaxID=229290 RepID=UPI0023ED359F|nr:transmembrane protein 174 [Anoplopoma fimbria]
MEVQRPEMETNRARNHTAILSAPPDDPTHVSTPAPRCCQSISLLENEKTGDVLLFSGLFLTLLGVTFTAMGWYYYKSNPDFEWTQLLGPVLISVGGTFVLTSVCKFGIILPCRERDKSVFMMPVMEQTSVGHSFRLRAINQSTVLYNATAMLCFPAQYNFTTQEVRQARELQNGVHAACPPPNAAHCVDNAAFAAEEEEESSVYYTEIDDRRSRIEKTYEGGRGDQSDATCSPPPAYEDLYPSFNKHNLT